MLFLQQYPAPGCRIDIRDGLGERFWVGEIGIDRAGRHGTVDHEAHLLFVRLLKTSAQGSQDFAPDHFPVNGGDGEETSDAEEQVCTY